MSKEKLVGITTEGNKVWQCDFSPTEFLIEGRYDGQSFIRDYKDCYQWVTFFKPVSRKFHDVYSKFTHEEVEESTLKEIHK